MKVLRKAVNAASENMNSGQWPKVGDWVVVNIQHYKHGYANLVPVKIETLVEKHPYCIWGWAWGERLHDYYEGSVVYIAQNEQDAMNFISEHKGKRSSDIPAIRMENTVSSSTEYADHKSDKRIAVTNQRYRGYMIRLDRGGDGYNVYDKYGELEDAGYPSRKAAKEFIDELVEADNDIRASFITASEDIDALWEVIDDEEFEFRGVQDVGYDNDGNIMVVFNHSIGEDMIEPTAEELLMAFRQYGYPVHEWDTNGQNVFILSRGSILGSTDTESLANDVIDDSDYNDDIQEIDQEFTSENTSINSKKLPAIFKMVSFEPGTINLDMGGGKFDNVADYLSEYDVTNLVYDPYNRTKEHNREVVKTIRQVGGADTATCSNVLNVIKEPEARRNVLVNMSKLVKPGGEIYITVYEGSGKGNEGPTKSGYQLNRKTADYLHEIQEVFPDARRRGKLIIAINSRSVSSSISIEAGSDDSAYVVSDEIRKAISGDRSAIQSLKNQGYRVRKLVNPLQYAEVGTFEIVDPTTGKIYNYDNSVSYYSKT